jgi:hypothetical protein
MTTSSALQAVQRRGDELPQRTGVPRTLDEVGEPLREFAEALGQARQEVRPDSGQVLEDRPERGDGPVIPRSMSLDVVDRVGEVGDVGAAAQRTGQRLAHAADLVGDAGQVTAQHRQHLLAERADAVAEPGEEVLLDVEAQILEGRGEGVHLDDEVPGGRGEILHRGGELLRVAWVAPPRP